MEDIPTNSLVIETHKGLEDVFVDGQLSKSYNRTTRNLLTNIDIYEDATEFYIRKTDESHEINIVNIKSQYTKLF